MTALDHRPRVPQPRGGTRSKAAEYEWRTFLDEAHLYPTVRLAAEWPPMILPWCEEDRPEQRRHELASIGEQRLRNPPLAIRCVRCGHRRRVANAEALRGQA